MSTASVNLTAAHELARTLVAGGVRHAVISPGSRNTPLVLAFDALLGERAHVVLDERSAGFVALGLARASGAPAALVCTSGSAAAHYLPALIEAHYGELPLVVITADRPAELHHCGAGQTIDQQRLFGTYARFFADLGVADAGSPPRAFASKAARALGVALGVPPGPVHLNVAFREPLWEPDAAIAPSPTEPLALETGRTTLDSAWSEQLAERVARARRGVIVCGPRAHGASLAHGPELSRAVASLARALGWPVLADATSGVRFSAEASDVCVAAYDPLLRDAGFAEVAAPELVLRIGQLPASKPLSQWLERHAAGRTVLVDAHGALHDPLHGAATLVRAEPAQLCQALAHLLRGRAPRGEWLATWRGAEAAAQSALAAACAEGFWEGALARMLTAALPEGSLLHVASSMPVRDLESFAAARAAALHVTSNRGANGIDGTIATAAGQALGWREGPAVALLGDLAFLHDVGSLITARQLGVDLTMVVVNNGGGGIFDFLPIAGHPTAFTKYFSTPQQADLAALGRAAGATWRRVGSAGELAEALAGVPGARGVSIIEAVVDRSQNVKRHRDAWQAVAAALAAHGSRRREAS